MLASFLVATLASTATVHAQDARDDEIFGAAAAGSPPAATPSTPAASAPAHTPATTSNATIDGKLGDSLQVGGRLEMRATASKVEDSKVGDGPLEQLKQADLYFDSRPNANVRAFLRARFSEQTSVKGVEQALDELWIKADWQRAVFFTVGKQHVKWGSGHTWNPTDFTASQSKDPFELFDRRLGQTMVKIHIPDEKRAFNYYALAQVADAKRNDDVGGALRGEFAFLGSGELALSFAAQRSQPTRAGIDVSTALGPIDAYVEAAASRRQTRTFYKGTLDPKNGQLPTAYQDDRKTFSQVVGGITKTWKYNDDDNATFGGEYFQNGLGYDDRDLAIYSLVNGQSPALYTGRRYASVFATLPSPGSWNDSAFYLSALRNLSDKSAQARLTATWTFYKEATLDLFVSRCFGDYGELCFRVPDTYQSLAQSPLIPTEQQKIIANLPTKRTIATAGAGFTMSF